MRIFSLCAGYRVSNELLNDFFSATKEAILNDAFYSRIKNASPWIFKAKQYRPLLVLEKSGVEKFFKKYQLRFTLYFFKLNIYF